MQFYTKLQHAKVIIFNKSSVYLQYLFFDRVAAAALFFFVAGNFIFHNYYYGICIVNHPECYTYHFAMRFVFAPHPCVALFSTLVDYR